MVSPAQDPQFLAFLRASGAEEADLANMAAMKKSQLSVNQGLRMPEYDQELRDGQRRISDDHAARGVYGSGAMASRQNEQAGDVQHKVQKDRIQTQGDADSIDMTLAQQISAIRRKQAEQTLTSTQNVTLGNARGVLSPLGG